MACGTTWHPLRYMHFFRMLYLKEYLIDLRGEFVQLTEGILRQRRNLITACVFLWIMKYGDITFTKMSFAGSDIIFGNPNALVTAIWIFFSYSLYRYYQYFSDEGVTNLSGTFDSALEKYCRPIIEDISNKLNSRFQPDGAYRTLKRNGWIYVWTRDEPYDPTSQTAPQTRGEVKITRWMLRTGILKAYLDSIFRNSVVTDFLLPFALAGFVIYYCGSDNWNGSFMRLLLGAP